MNCWSSLCENCNGDRSCVHDHKGMASPEVADGGTASNMERSHEYTEYVVAVSRQRAVLQLGGWSKWNTQP